MRFLELDALRGIASLTVLLFHFTRFSSGTAPFNYNIGSTGVDFFFMLSGFVILMTLDKKPSVGQFFWGRITRIVPTYWACATVTLIAIYIHGNVDAWATFQQYLWNLTMIQSYLRVENLDGPYWTLIIEWLFYGVMALVLGLRALKYIEWIMLALLLLSGLYGIDQLNVHFPKLYYTLKMYVPLMNHIPSFFAGILLYRIKLTGGRAWRYPLFVLALIIQTTLTNETDRAIQFVTQTQYNWALLSYALVMVLFVENQLGFLAKPWTLFLGKISYPLFLIHQFIGTVMMIPFLTYGWGWNFFPAFFVTLAVCMVLATGIHYWIEIPTYQWLRKIAGMESHGLSHNTRQKSH